MLIRWPSPYVCVAMKGLRVVLVCFYLEFGMVILSR